MNQSLQLPAWDARWVYVERPETPTQVFSVYVFDPGREGRVDLDSVVQHLMSRAGAVSIFRRRLLRVPFDLDHPYWVDAGDFAVEEHVTTKRIDGGWASFAGELAELAGLRVDLSRPPWHLHVVHGLCGIPGIPDGAIAVVLRIHHCASDGLGAVEVARHLFSSEALPKLATTEGRPLARARVFALGVIRVPLRVGQFAGGLVCTVAASRRSIKEVTAGVYPIPEQAPRMSINAKVGTSRVFDAVTLQLADVRAVKNAVGGGVTINDVMLSVIGGAMRAYLAEHNDSPSSALVAMVPKSILDDRTAATGNHFTCLIVSLRTDVVDAAERAMAIHASVEDEKRRKASPAVNTAEKFSRLIPGFALRLLFKSAAKQPANGPTVATNTAISNVPRGQAMQLLGAPALTTFGPLGLDDGHGLVHMVSSIADVLTISVTADPVLVPDLDRYVELVESEFEQLASQLGQRA